MKNKLSKIKQNTFARYVFVGGASYVIEVSLLMALYNLFDFSRTLSAAISYWVGLLLAFFLQKIVAFKDYRKETRAITRQGFLYMLLTVWNYIFTLLVVSVFSDKYLLLSRTLAQAMLTSWNYVIYKKVIFKKDTPNLMV